MPSERMFGLLLRVCPAAARDRFGAGMRYAWATDLAAARRRGRLRDGRLLDCHNGGRAAVRRGRTKTR